MTATTRRQRVHAFRALHRGDPILVLPNAWDVISARLFEVEGFAALGTTSAGIAAVAGYPDVQRISADEMLDRVRAICSAVDLPVNADLEAGYAATPEGVAAHARRALEAGAAGINLEDGTGIDDAPLVEPERQQDVLRAVREAVGDGLVLNARVDVLLTFPGPPSAGRMRATVSRGNAYLDAGADCIFVPDHPGTLDRAAIATLVREIDGPLNLVAGPGTPPLGELQALGVARVSFGPRPMRAALALVRRMAREWRSSGTYETMNADMLGYAEVNALLERWEPGRE